MAEPAGITITRVFEAPRERVWKEWTEPEAFADWFGGSESEVPLSGVSMDVRPGGSWWATMFAEPGRREIRWKGEYREVVEPERLVLTDLGDGRTEMLFQQRGRMSAELYKRAGEGWSTFFDRVAERLEVVD